MSQSKQSLIDYEGFVEKFKPKRTTDDCYTPPEVYEVVRDWACAEYGIDPAKVVRPFYPGGDYESYEYPDGCTVLDNPPFSIVSKIVRFYLDRGIPFFIFAPSLTVMNSRGTVLRCCHLVCDCQIEYENGARLRTSFVTSYDGGTVARSAPDLTRLINEKVDELRRRSVKELPRYEYPDNIATASMLMRYAKHGVDFRIRRGECAFVSALDSQRAAGKGIYGGGLLLSDDAASRKARASMLADRNAAAERAADGRARANVWELSDRERAMVAMLGKD